MSLIQDNIDYSLFHYIVEADTPKRAWNILKEVFNEHPVVQQWLLKSHKAPGIPPWSGRQSSIYEAGSDHVISEKILDLFVFVDDSEKKPANVAVLSDVNDSPCV